MVQPSTSYTCHIPSDSPPSKFSRLEERCCSCWPRLFQTTVCSLPYIIQHRCLNKEKVRLAISALRLLVRSLWSFDLFLCTVFLLAIRLPFVNKLELSWVRVVVGIYSSSVCHSWQLKLVEKQTSPPDYLSEAELISLMEKHGIGTDASIPVHINNICERNYVTVSAGRRLKPTTLGVVLVHGYQKVGAVH